MKTEKLSNILVNAWTNNKEAFSWMSTQDKEKLLQKASHLEEDIKNLSLKRKVYLASVFLNLYLEGKSSPKDESKTLQKYINMAKYGSIKDSYFQIVGEYKFNRLIGKVMQVVEMLPLDEKKQEATKATLKDYIYDCMNENSCIRADIFKELQKDGLPIEEHVYA